MIHASTMARPAHDAAAAWGPATGGPVPLPAAVRRLSTNDFAIGTWIAAGMAALFATVTTGNALVATFIPGLAVAWLVYAWMYAKRIELPAPARFFPLYFATLGIQFLHFAEEFATGFATRFPMLYGGAPFSNELFVTFNMVSYFVFALGCILALHRNLRFLLVPVLFFIVYGAIGNAIAHTWWAIRTKGYYPGFVTAQLYWIAGPVLLYQVMPSKKGVALVVCGFAIALIACLTLLASA